MGAVTGSIPSSSAPQAHHAKRIAAEGDGSAERVRQAEAVSEQPGSARERAASRHACSERSAQGEGQAEAADSPQQEHGSRSRRARSHADVELTAAGPVILHQELELRFDPGAPTDLEIVAPPAVVEDR